MYSNIFTNMKSIIVLAILFSWMLSIVGAGEVIIDSKPIIESSLYHDPNAAWQNWFYDPFRRDYAGAPKPMGYRYKERKGYRKEHLPKPANVLVTIILIGNRPKKGKFKPIRALRSNLHVSKIREFLSSVSELKGAYHEDGKIYLVGKKRLQKGPSIFLPEDFIVAIRTAVNSTLHGAGVSFENPPLSMEKQSYNSVQYLGLIKNSHIGQVFFESDRLLKCISLGADNSTKKPLAVNTAWHVDKFAFKDVKNVKPQEVWHRFWFTVDNMEINTDSKGGIIQFAKSNLSVDAQLRKGPKKLYFEKNYDSETGRFSKNMTENYDNYKMHFPVLNELAELAKLIATFKWFYQMGIVVKFDKKDVETFYTRYTPDKIPVIKVTKTKTLKKITMRKYEVTDFVFSSVGGVEASNYKFKNRNLSEFKQLIRSSGDYLVFNIL